MTAVRRGYVDLAYGQLHVALTEPDNPVGPPLVLLHQTPRSWDEYAEVIVAIGGRRRVIAPDLPGMGGSDPHPGGASIEAYGDAVVAGLDALGVAGFDLVGHHTGGVVAVEVAATVGERVRRLVLSSTPFVDAEGRELRRHRPPIDAVDADGDGKHLVELWQRRQRFYPEGRPDLLARFVRDAMRAHDPEDGHRAVAAYVMEERIGRIAAPALLVGHASDPYAFKELEPLAEALADAGVRATRAVIDGGQVPLEFTAPEFARVVEEFLAS